MNATLNQTYAHHPPTLEQITRFQALRDRAKALAQGIIEMTPQSREQSVALTNVQQAVMWANAAIAINEGGTV